MRRSFTGRAGRAVVPALVAVVALSLIVVAVSGLGGAATHRVQMTVPAATGLSKGFDVRQSGVRVGRVATAELTSDYRVRIALDLTDDAWPLPQDTTFTMRHGGTIKFSDRYIEINRGSADATLEDGATIPAAKFADSVEFDEVFGVFDRDTRVGLKRLLNNGGRAAPGVEANLAPALREGPEAADATASVLRQLGDDPEALDVLLRNTSAVADAAASANPGIGELVQGIDQTFSATASRARELQSVLDQAPETLTAARATASKADGTLEVAKQLTDELDPGITELRAITRPLTHLLRTVVDVGPDARSTLSTLSAAAPSLDSLIDRVADPLLPQVESIGRQAATQLNCIRPFSPEIGGLTVNWATLWGAAGDAADKIFRAQVGATALPNDVPVPSGTVAELLPDGALRMAFPRPPGQLVNKPWFQPECGITEDALDITKDPEAKAVDPMSKPLLDVGDPGEDAR